MSTTDGALPPVGGADTVAPSIENAPVLESREVTMGEGTAESAASPLPFPAGAASQSNAASPLHPSMRTGTPARTAGLANGDRERGDSSSRAPSAHPDPGFNMPAEAPKNGAPVRDYLNSKVTGPLLEGVKLVAKEKPNDPLRVLGEYLIKRSQELEGTGKVAVEVNDLTAED